VWDYSDPLTSPSFTSNAIREEAVAVCRSIPTSPKKMTELTRLIVGLSAREALIQMKLSHKKKANYVYKTIQNAIGNALSFNMNKDRLVITRAFTTRAPTPIRVDFKAKGRTGIRHRYYCHIEVRIREQAMIPSERRIGFNKRAGWTKSTIEKSLTYITDYRTKLKQQKLQSLSQTLPQ